MNQNKFAILYLLLILFCCLFFKELCNTCSRLFDRRPRTEQFDTKNIIYCFWTGENQMSPKRAECLEQLKQISECKVILVTPANLDEYITIEDPLHPAYPYLSETHKADYLRTYFMHFYGGGYSDIKKTTGSWTNAFNQISADDNIWICGYPEINGGVAHPDFTEHWQDLIGNCAYVCKPNTPLTSEWYNDMIVLLDNKYELLKKNPSSHPQDSADSAESKYPIEWNEMLGRIFHRICHKYKDHISNALPISVFENYR